LKKPVSTTKKAQCAKYRLSTINQQKQQEETIREIHYLISETILFGGLSFGVRQRVAAFQSGVLAPHSKKVFSRAAVHDSSLSLPAPQIRIA